MDLDSKLKINFFCKAMEKYIRFSNLFFISVLVMYVSMERLYVAKFDVAVSRD